MAGTVKKLQFSEGTDVGAPTDLSLATSTSVIKAFVNDAAYVTSEGPATNGSVYLNTTIGKFRYFITDWRNAVPESDLADPTKRFLLDLTGNSTGVTSTLDFNNTANRTYTYPNFDGTLATLAGTESLSNKTLASALISGGSLDVNAAGALALGASIGANNFTLGGALTTVIVPGNLTVNGTLTRINTTDLDVTDKNITVNDGGNDASSQGAGLTVERTSTFGSLIFDSALASKWKLGLLGSEVQVADVSSTQTFTGKTLTGNTIISFIGGAGATITAPSAPGTLATLAGTETFTNKTLTSPVINTPTTTGMTHRGTLLLQNLAGAAQPVFALSEDPDNGTDVVNIQAPASLAASYTLTLPIDDGTSGQVLSTDGSGVLSWTSALSNPMTTLGDTIYGAAAGSPTRLVGSITTARKYLTQTGTGAVSAAPAWSSLLTPTVQKFTSGSGTYTTPAGVAWLRVRLVGGGGGGGGSGTAAGTNGGAGGNSTFGTTLLAANGGNGGGRWDQNGGGAGGSASLGTGPVGLALTGGYGASSGFTPNTGFYTLGGSGGNTAFGGAGGNGVSGGQNGAANTGSGGGGGGTTGAAANSGAGGGGGASGYVDAIIVAPLGTYAYSVATAGTAGTAGTNGNAGGAGAAGQIIVEEYYA